MAIAPRALFHLLLILFLSWISKHDSLETLDSSSSRSCIGSERSALLKFNKSLKDPSGWLSSWTSEDCCNWEGVTCSNSTGNVLKLDLKSPDFCDELEESDFEFSMCLTGELNPSLLDLKHLSYLDLSGNNFLGIQIPSFLGSIKNLVFLDLSSAGFSGMVPPHLGNLSKLTHLDLTSYAYPTLWASELNWLSGLSSLRFLGLGGVKLRKTGTRWFEPINKLASLLELNLFGCKLRGFPRSRPSANFTSLQVLDLSFNNFNSSIPQWLFSISTLVELKLTESNLRGPIPIIKTGTLCNLQRLDLSFNNISGEIRELVKGLSGCSNSSLEVLDLTQNNFSGNLPDGIGSLANLRTLRINQNSFTGPIPMSIGDLLSLEELGLSANNMNGKVPESIGKLSELVQLDMIENSWEGVLSEIHFQDLGKLKRFSVSSIGKSLAFDVRPDWIPSFSLRSIRVTDCRIGPKFPEWLRTQKEITEISLANALISDIIPDWFWNLSPHISTLDLSRNLLRGKIPKLLNFDSEASVSLGFNRLEGTFPFWANVSRLSLEHNLLSGPIPENVSEKMSMLQTLYLSSNAFSGTLPSSLSDLKQLTYLGLSSNRISGDILTNWTQMNRLKVLDLSNNSLSGSIPSSICSLLPSLEFLKLSNNRLSGNFPSSMGNCTDLSMIDIGGNRFSGTIPQWNQVSMVNLQALILKENRFRGKIPEQLCRLGSLHILDLSYNKLSGSIPRCVGNLTGFQSYSSYHQLPPAFKPAHPKTVDLVLKGREMEYSELIPLVNLIDLSKNDLQGIIPSDITKLSSLGTLNLSSNQLTGKIPDTIGALQRLETLDISSNHLSGPIPPSMSSLTLLAHLNLSYNNLSGLIPVNNQFGSFDPSVYEGNPGLCGPPLSTKCSKSGDVNDPVHEDEGGEDGFEELWFFVSMALGFVVGFWGVCGTLVIKNSWRYAFFRMVDRLKDRLVRFLP